MTAGADPALRRVARRWLRGAPPPDDVWSFSDARPRSVGPVRFDLGGHSIDAASATFASRESAGGLDVAVHHPAFSRLEDQARTAATFLLLDALLGVDVVELWVGQVVAVAEPGPDRPLSELVGTVAKVAQRGTTADGEVGFVVLRGGPDHAPVVRRQRIRLSPVQSPEHDQHVAITVGLPEVRPDGMPTPTALDEADSLEQHLVEMLGDAAYLVVVETGQDRRVMHWYVDSTTPAAEQVRAAVGGWRHGPVSLAVAVDPGWSAVKRPRGAT